VQAKVGEEQIGACVLEGKHLGVGLRQLDLVEPEPVGVPSCLCEHAGREVEAEVAHLAAPVEAP
jgi:hypothetical protein